MAHIPHLFVEEFGSESAELSVEQRRHLQKVLRYQIGSPLSYTDGRGLLGTGVWDGVGVIRSDERQAPSRRMVTVAVAPPKAKDRQRLIVEKLGELGISRLIWLTSRYGQVASPAPARCRAWAVGALEQSRSAFLMEIDVGSLSDLPGVVLADVGGIPLDPDVDTLAIGPEGGWHPDEMAGHKTFCLSDQVLRTETAAIVGGALLRGPRMVT